MTGMMMVFMLIAITFMLRIEQTTTLVVKEYEETKNDLSQALQKEFARDLELWNAKLLGDMTIRFNDPDVLFDTGSAHIKPAFKEILNDFIPRYINLVTSEKYIDSIKEIRIEGHTSKRWASERDEKKAFIKNMRLSQERAQSMLEYILNQNYLQTDQTLVQKYLTAAGFSSSRPIYNRNNKIDESLSQRVEFVIIANADAKMNNIFNELLAGQDG